jgi:cytochrome b561
MMNNSKAEDYSAVAKLLHWLILALLAAQFAIAWTMPDIGRNTRPEGLVAWHLSVGTVILLLVVIRVLWRLTHPAPKLPVELPRWQRSLASLMHFLLYAILVLLPLMGWGNASARGWDVSLFGVLKLPRLFDQGSPFGHTLGDVHSATAIALLVLVGLHAAAALYHHLILKDRILMRMMPWRSRS